jgi:hypothetical protein
MTAVPKVEDLRPGAGRDHSRLVAGADVFSKQSDGTTVAVQYCRLGIRLTCASTDRINGWAEILQRLGDPDAGVRPTMFMHADPNGVRPGSHPITT